MSLKPFDPSSLRDDQDDEGASLTQGATSMHRYDTVSMKKLVTETHPRRTRWAAIVVAVAAVALVAVVAVVVILNFSAAASQQDETGNIELTIPANYGAGDIAQLLQQSGVITSTTDFMNAVQAAGNVDSSLKAGAYSFERNMSYEDVIKQLVAGPNDASKTLTIPEGLTVTQVAQRVQDALGISSDDFLVQAKASNYVANYSFLSGAYNDSLEGYLFPKTYTFGGEDVTADMVIRAMLDQFQAEIGAVNLGGATQGATTLNLSQVVVLASLIERETAVADERPLVASVVYNRLNAGMYLQIDAAINYALGKDDLLSTEDLQVESPYNTYTNLGLPPGPICSPSLASLQAAAGPAQTDYYYYVAAPALDGTHTFCTTEDEFWAARDAYNQAMGF